MTARLHAATLLCHLQTPTKVVRGIVVHVRRSPPATLALTFLLDADLERLRIPAPRPSCMTHGLWDHTCFETFIALNNTAAYHEFNFAPSGEWMVYAFSGYREFASQPDTMPAPEMVMRRSADRLELDVTLRLDTLSAAHATGSLRLALAAVIEDENGSLSYWALRHPAGKPDFHHTDAFALTLEAPGVDSAGDPR